MKVQEAIQTIETLGGYKFIRRCRHFNLDTNRTETAYVFDSVGARHDWDHETWFDCLSELRFHARQFAYTHGVR
jgi:hypothetical protein